MGPMGPMRQNGSNGPNGQARWAQWVQWDQNRHNGTKMGTMEPKWAQWAQWPNGPIGPCLFTVMQLYQVVYQVCVAYHLLADGMLYRRDHTSLYIYRERCKESERDVHMGRSR